MPRIENQSLVIFWLAALMLVACTALGQQAPRNAAIEPILQRPSARVAHWGVHAVDVGSGAVVASINADKLFVPASNRKLVSTAIAARTLPRDERLVTIFHTPGSVSSGTINGDLVVRAVGDPSWHADVRGGAAGRVRLDTIARDLSQAGITQVRGDLVIDGSRFAEFDLMPPAWNWEDFQAIYGSFASVLSIDKNLGRISFRPGAVGEPPVISTSGARPPFEIINDAVTGREGSAPTMTLTRDLAGRSVRFTGSLPAGTADASRAIALGNPTLHAAWELHAALERAGITVSGTVRLSSASIAVGQVLGSIEGVPLATLLSRANSDSDNYVAEALYVLSGAQLFSHGSYDSALEAERRYWRRIGVADDQWVGFDGSGLSRKNHVSPSALTALLVDMNGDDLFVQSLARSGHAGTLRYRLSDAGMQGRVRAKTGTLDGVSGLSGYVTASNGRTIAFSIMANHYTARASTTRANIDDIVKALAQ